MLCLQKASRNSSWLINLLHSVHSRQKFPVFAEKSVAVTTCTKKVTKRKMEKCSGLDSENICIIRQEMVAQWDQTNNFFSVDNKEKINSFIADTWTNFP
jgi:hypothetical protein